MALTKVTYVDNRQGCVSRIRHTPRKSTLRRGRWLSE